MKSFFDIKLEIVYQQVGFDIEGKFRWIGYVDSDSNSWIVWK